MTGGTRTIERMRHDIEVLVMEEVWLGRRRSATAWVLVAALSSTTLVWRAEVTGNVVTVAVSTLLVASTASVLALVRRRYRWCCAAAYCTGLASVFGTGAFWWLRTGHFGSPLLWLTLADVAVVVLTGFWLMVIVTPIDRSQPDMRTTSR